MEIEVSFNWKWPPETPKTVPKPTSSAGSRPETAEINRINTHRLQRRPLGGKAKPVSVRQMMKTWKSYRATRPLSTTFDVQLSGRFLRSALQVESARPSRSIFFSSDIQIFPGTDSEYSSEIHKSLTKYWPNCCAPTFFSCINHWRFFFRWKPETVKVDCKMRRLYWSTHWTWLKSQTVWIGLHCLVYHCCPPPPWQRIERIVHDTGRWNRCFCHLPRLTPSVENCCEYSDELGLGHDGCGWKIKTSLSHINSRPTHFCAMRMMLHVVIAWVDALGTNLFSCFDWILRAGDLVQLWKILKFVTCKRILQVEVWQFLLITTRYNWRMEVLLL